MDGLFGVQGVILAYWEMLWKLQRTVHTEASELKILELQVPFL